MFCPNCGNSQQENAAFCSVCGAPMNLTPAASTTPATPAVRMRKGQYLKSELASSKAKTLSKAVLIIFAVCALIVVLSISNLLNGAVHKLPVMSVALKENEIESFEKELDELDSIVEEARDIYQENKDKVNKDTAKAIEKALDKTEKFAKNPSLSNMQSLVSELRALDEKYTDEIEKAGLSDKLDIDGFSNEFEGASCILDTLKVIFIMLGAAIIFFTLVAALFKRTAFAIFGLIISLPVCAFCGGILYTVLAVVTFITLIVMVAMINAEYKKYKKSLA